MDKKYFIFDRFDFLSRFFSRFFYNEFSFGRTKFTRSSSDKPVSQRFLFSLRLLTFDIGHYRKGPWKEMP